MSSLRARGDVWWCAISDTGRRPVVVLCRDTAIPRRSVHHDRPWLASEVVLEPGDDPVPTNGVASVGSIGRVALGVLTERIGRLADARMRQLCEALDVAVDCDR